MKQCIFLSFLSMMIVSSCSTILVNTTNREGMQENPARRTPGAVVEDQSIETIIAVNLKADSLAFRETRFNVVSHNGVVLLVGQIESDSMKQKATEIISKASSKIKRIHAARCQNTISKHTCHIIQRIGVTEPIEWQNSFNIN